MSLSDWHAIGCRHRAGRVLSGGLQAARQPGRTLMPDVRSGPRDEPSSAGEPVADRSFSYVECSVRFSTRPLRHLRRLRLRAHGGRRYVEAACGSAAACPEGLAALQGLRRAYSRNPDHLDGSRWVCPFWVRCVIGSPSRFRIPRVRLDRVCDCRNCVDPAMNLTIPNMQGKCAPGRGSILSAVFTAGS